MVISSAFWRFLLHGKPPGPILPLHLLLVLGVPHTLLLCSLQISPQIYQSLHFKELAPTQQPDFMMHKVLDQQGRLTLRGTMPNYTASTSAATASSPTSSSPSTSGSGFLELSVPASPQLQPFQALPQPCSAPVPRPPALSCPRYPGTSCRGQ